jgi:hypothetical protein
MCQIIIFFENLFSQKSDFLKEGIEKVGQMLSDEESYDSKEEIPSNFVYKEGGWGWVVCVSTGYCFGILMGLVNNYALIYNEFDIVYNQTENHIFYAGIILCRLFLFFIYV